MNKLTSVCVFCGSAEGARKDYAEAAWELGKRLAAEKITLVFGGGHVGLMGITADSVMKHGGKVIGVIPGFLNDKELAHKGITELVIVETMHQRKQRMADLSDGFIALPGGIGTLEELAEILTWSQLSLHTKPVGIINVKKYYNPLLEFLDKMADQKFLREENLNLFVTGKTPGKVIEKMKAWKSPEAPKWPGRDKI